MKRLLTGLAGLVALTTSSCAISFLTTTPQNVVINQIETCPTASAKAENVKVLSTQAWAQGVIVLYSALCPSNDANNATRLVFGHKVVTRHGMSWQVSGSGSYGSDTTTTPTDELIEYSISQSADTHTVGKALPQDRYTVLYGRALKPAVVAVEATFDNGKTVRDANINGVFALISPGATGVCALRVLGYDDQILREETLAIPKQLIKQEHAAQCLPEAHQL